MKKTKVACLGPQATFTHEAALRRFPSAEIQLCDDFEKVFDAVYNSNADYGVLPIENAIGGMVDETFHLLLGQGENLHVTVCGDLVQEIEMYLYAPEGATLETIRHIHTKDAAWKQCGKWVRDKFGIKADFISETSTSKAAEIVRDSNDITRAAIAGELAGKVYGLKTIARGIQNVKGNATRFYILTNKKTSSLTNKTKGLFAVVLHDRIGAMYETLEHFSKRFIDIRRIKVIPMGLQYILAWRDWFVIEVEFSDFQKVTEMVTALRKEKHLVLEIKELGYYGRLTRQKKTESSPNWNIWEKARWKKTASEQPEDIINGGESENVEFKSSLRWDLKERQLNDKLEFAVIKTIVGFMNSTGGTLIIGISDDGNISGLELDYKTLTKQNRDGFELFLRNKMSKYIPYELHQFVTVLFSEIDKKDICTVKVKPSPREVWIDQGQQTDFYVRSGNRTVPLTAKSAIEYIKLRWGK